MNADTLTMLCREGDLKQTTIFNVSSHLRAIFQKSFENSMILPAALSGRFLFLMTWCHCVLRTLLLVALFLTWTVVGERRFRPSVAVVDGRRFRPTSRHLEFISMSIMIGTATTRTIARRIDYVGNHQNYQLRSGICCEVQTSFSPYQWMLLHERARSHVLLSS